MSLEEFVHSSFEQLRTQRFHGAYDHRGGVIVHTIVKQAQNLNSLILRRVILDWSAYLARRRMLIS